jgi:hypothetical protein
VPSSAAIVASAAVILVLLGRTPSAAAHSPDKSKTLLTIEDRVDS